MSMTKRYFGLDNPNSGLTGYEEDNFLDDEEEQEEEEVTN
jgi:hypothetical protein